MAAVLAFAVFASFAPALHAQFLSDDTNAIVNNEAVTGPLDLRGIFSTFSWWGAGRSDAPGFRPLTTLSFAANHAFSGLDVASYHAVNLVLHALVSFLVYLVALELGTASGAAIAGLGFALLPIHSEAVVWVVGRAELLAAGGFLTATLALLRHRASGNPGYLLAACMALIAGLLSKENAITLLAVPAVATMTLPVHGGRERSRDAAATVALGLALLAYLALRSQAGPLFAEGSTGALDNPLLGAGWMTRLRGAAAILGHYTALIVWPHPFSIDYSFDAIGLGPNFGWDRYATLGVATLVAVAGAAGYFRRRNPPVVFALGLAAASYSIVSNALVPIGTLLGERLVYLPTAGLLLAVGLGVEPLLQRWQRPTLAILLVIAAAWAGVDYRRSLDWRTPISLFEATVAAVPRSARAHMELATAYGRDGRTEEALKEFAAAVVIKPDYAAALYNQANMLARHGRHAEAIQAYLASIEANPKIDQSFNNLAMVYRLTGQNSRLIPLMRRALAAKPKSPSRKSFLADELLAANPSTRQAYEEAHALYTSALAQTGPNAALYFGRALATQRLSGCGPALPDLRAAYALAPSEASLAQSFAHCLRQIGEPEEAARITESLRFANHPADR